VAEIWKLHPMLTLPTVMPFNCKKDFGTLSPFIDVSFEADHCITLVDSLDATSLTSDRSMYTY